MFIRRVKGKPDLYVVHGEHENNEFFLLNGLGTSST
jgi:hypothetical protein